MQDGQQYESGQGGGAVRGGNLTLPAQIIGGLHGLKIHWADIFVIIVYFVLSLSVGIWSICRGSRKSVQGFFLAGKSMTWIPVGLSMFASNIGSEHFVGLAGTASVSGVAAILFEWGAIPLIVMMAWLFLPVYINSGIYTIPEFMERRFGGQRLRIYISILALLSYLVSMVSVDLYSGALFIQQALQWDIYAGVFILLGLTSLYTICGGLSTVMLTDALAVVVMVVGGIVVTVIGLRKVGGYNNLKHLYMNALPSTAINNTNNTCGFPREDAFHIFRDPIGADYPWPGTVMRVFLGGLWFWCANQLIVQRALAAKNIKHAKAGAVLAAYIKFIPFLIMTIPGMISRVLFPDEVACADVDVCRQVCGNPSGCSNIAYPKIVVELLPAGARGLILAVMIAAVVSSLTSLFNSASTIITLDIWRKIRPKCGDLELLIVGRVFIILLAGVSIMWIPIMQEQEGGQIIRYSTKAVGYLGAPTSAIFLLAMFWSRCTEQGAFWGMVTSALVGITRLVLDFTYAAPYCGQPDTRPVFISKFHGYYHFTLELCIAFLVAVVVSLLTKPIPKYKLDGVTFWTRKKKPFYEKWVDGVKSDRLAINKTCESDRQAFQNDCMELKAVEDGQNTVKVDSIHSTKRRQILWLKVLQVICGLPSTEELQEGANAHANDDYESRVEFLHEPRFFHILMNINAVLILAIFAVLFIVFG